MEEKYGSNAPPTEIGIAITFEQKKLWSYFSAHQKWLMVLYWKVYVTSRKQFSKFQNLGHLNDDVIIGGHANKILKFLLKFA